MPLLTDDEVGIKASAKGGLLSDADLGLQAKSSDEVKPITTGENLKQTGIEVLENIGNAAAATLDLAAGLPADAAGKILSAGTQAYAAVKGESPKITGQAGEEAEALIPQKYKAPFATWMKQFTGSETDQSVVGKSIDSVAEGISSMSHGLIQPEGVKYILGSAMDAGGLAGVRAALPKLVERIAKPTVADQAGKVAETAKAGPAEAAKQAAKPHLRGEEAQTYLKDVARKAFPEDQDYSSHLSFLEEEKLNTEGPAPKPKLSAEETKAYLAGQKGAIDPQLLKWLGVGAGTFLATTQARRLYDYWNNPERDKGWIWDPDKMHLDPNDPTENWGVGALGGLAAFGAIKGKGGMWHREAAERLAKSIQPELYDAAREGVARTPEQQAAYEANVARSYKPQLLDWSSKAVKGYLNKHAGTATDPLKDVEIPFATGTKRWEDVTDRAFKGEQVQGPKGPETQFTIPKGDGKTLEGSQAHFNQQALTSYLSHVGDYLREHVSPEKLSQYDLVRAVKETRKWDDELAKNMDKARAAEKEVSPVHKQYPDGMYWQQLTKPGQFARESDAMGHSVRGYEPPRYKEGPEGGAYAKENPEENPEWTPASGDSGHPSYGLGGWEAIKSGDAKVYSLRDAKGRSHATIEVGLPAEGHFTKSSITPFISQIKGKQNRAPSAEYLPYVQDFVKSGKWGEVGDLGNAGMAKDAKGDYIDVTKARQYDQRGSVDPRLLARMAAVGTGAFAGSQIDGKEGAFWGALAGAAIGHTSPGKTVAGIKRIFESDKRLRIKDLADAHEVAIDRSGRDIWQLQKGLEAKVPKAERRAAITHAIEANDLSGLSTSEKEVAGMAKEFFKRMKQIGLDSKVLKDSLENYVTHLWGKDAKTQSILDEVFPERASGPSTSPTSRFALRRSVPTIAEGKAKGMTPVTEDIAAIIGVYGNSIVRALENKRLLTTLKETPVGDTKAKLVMPMKSAPAGYKRINSPQFAGQLVHPDIVPSLRFMFDNPNPGVAMRAIEGVNTAVKRSAVSLSLFHAKALTDAYIGAHGPIMGPIKAVPQIAHALVPKVFPEGKYLKMLREGGAGDLVDKAILGGLKFTKKGLSSVDEDINGSFYGMLRSLQDVADKTIPGAGHGVKAYAALNHFVDGVMWERLHAGMKLETFAVKYEALLENNTKAHLRDPAKNPLRSEREVAEAAASFTNDIFGGLNWRRVAESAKTRWGRDLALSALSPTGRRGLQLALFAPDWTLSTTRAAIKAFGPKGSLVAGGATLGAMLAPDDHKTAGQLLGGAAGFLASRAGRVKGSMGEGSGLRGLVEAKTVADLHRQYILRSALYYVAAGDAINYAMSGHHLWDNKDPTTIDMGDGRTMQWSKHTMEPVHWLTKPGQQALNKLGAVPKELATQALGTEYLTTSGRSPPMHSRLGHLAKNLEPIAVQQGKEGDFGSGIAGFLGAPIYGKTFAERDALKESERLRRRMGVR